MAAEEDDAAKKGRKSKSRVGKWLGFGVFMFFLIKGLAWLVVPAAVAVLATIEW